MLRITQLLVCLIYQNQVTTKVSDFKPKLNMPSNFNANSNFPNYNVLARIATLLFCRVLLTQSKKKNLVEKMQNSSYFLPFKSQEATRT